MDTHTPSPEALSWAQRLVRMNTVSSNSNLPLIECIAVHLRTLGVPLLEVSAERPAVRVPEALLQPNFDERAIREEVLSAGYTERPSSWWLVSEA